MKLLLLLLQLILCLILLNNQLIDCSLNDRLDCWLEYDFSVDKDSCEQRGCIWDGEKRPNGVPICYLDRNRVGYRRVGDVRSNTSTGGQLDLSLKDTARRVLKNSPQIESVRFEWTYLTDRIVRVKLVDPKSRRYEVPVQQNFPLLVEKTEPIDPKKLQYSVDISDDKQDFSFSIQRKSTKTKLFDTSIGGLIYSDQLLQIATRLPTGNVYGMGENTHHSLRHDFTNYKTYPLFTQDRATGDEQFNYYGVHPFYTCLESDGQSHGILYLSSNAMEYTLLPEPGLSFKTLGGVLDMFVFVGDSPGHVIELYTSLIGRPILPPFWGLGYQLTRWGFKNTDDLRAVIDRNQKANVPLDVMYMDIDYMDQYHDFSYNRQSFAGLPQLINETKFNDNLHWTLILDPAIEAVEKDNPVFMDGYNRDVYVKWDKSIAKQDRYNPPNVPSDRDVLYGKVWPRGPAAFPDFFKNVTHDWWIRWVGQLHKDLQFDALWIDMNEPANQNDQIYHCPQNKYDYPAVRTKALYGNGVRELGHKTLCMTTKQGDHNEYLHYDVHSLYGLTETMATQKAIHAATGKRGFAVSRSTYVSSGRYGTHWLGDNFSVWDNMKFSIIGILEFNMFGINFVGPDICGFLSNTTPELCKRWHQLGAFYPFSRNHNCIGNRDQDPASWITAGHPEVTDAMKVAFSLRYKLLPYFYTLFYKGHTRGQTVARPLFHEFPTDNNTHSIDEQFMFGPAVLVSPFLYEGQKQVKAYLPDTNTVWYDLNLNQSKPGYVVIDDNGMIPVHLRGGYILPISSEPNHVNTRTVREGGLNLLVLPDQSGRAVGDFFWDDGDSIDTIEKLEYNYYTFSLENNTLDLTVEKLNYKTKQLIKLIEIVSSSEGQTWTVTLDGKPLPLEVKVHGGVAQIPVNIDLIGKSVGEKWSLKWKPAF